MTHRNRWSHPGPGARLPKTCSGLLLLAVVVALSLAAPVAAQPGGPLPAPLPLFPADNWWNADVSAAPLDPQGGGFLDFIGRSRGLHPDFGGDADDFPEIYGLVYVSVPGSQPLVPVTFVEFGDQSDDGAPGRPAGYPIPPQAKTEAKWIEGGYPGDAEPGGDRHMLIVDRDNRILYELYHTQWNADLARWEAGSGAVWPLTTNRRRPETWTSADAAGLAILPGLVRYDETFGAEPIRHAFRFTVRATNGHVYPASHTAGSTSGAPPMGLRLRLKAGKDISGYPPEIRRIFQAMKTYGLILADNGSDMYISGAHDTRWNNDVLNPAFSSLKAGDFEVIQRGWQPSTQPPPTPPAAPSNLQATALSQNRVALLWTDNSNNEQTFQVDMRTGAGAFTQVASLAAGVRATEVAGLAASTAYTFRVKAQNAAGSSAWSNTTTVTTPPAQSPACTPNDVRHCLNNGRFQVEVQWTAPGGATGAGRRAPLTNDTGLFWFFDPQNVEMIVKVLNGCALNGRYWVFAGGLTNVRAVLTVTDTQTGARKQYTNPQGAPFQPIQDTGAFASCP
jgi:Fibronectin type III domain